MRNCIYISKYTRALQTSVKSFQSYFPLERTQQHTTTAANRTYTVALNKDRHQLKSIRFGTASLPLSVMTYVGFAKSRYIKYIYKSLKADETTTTPESEHQSYNPNPGASTGLKSCKLTFQYQFSY